MAPWAEPDALPTRLTMLEPTVGGAGPEGRTLAPVSRHSGAVDARRRGGEVACDQTPRNVFYIRDILDAFPEARIINMVRDPRAVLLSQKNKWRRRSLGESALPRSEVVRSWSNYHPIVTARIWRGAVDAEERGDAVDHPAGRRIAPWPPKAAGTPSGLRHPLRGLNG